MAQIKIRGVTLRASLFGEADKYITILAEDCGKISAVVKGASKITGKLFACARPFAYCDFILFKKGDYMRVTSADVIYPFAKLADSYGALCLGLYFLEVMDKTLAEGANCDEFLRLLLHALYAASRERLSRNLTRAVFELKLLSLLGFEPFLNGCVSCGAANAPYFYADGLRCEKCAPPGCVNISEAALAALFYILGAQTNKIFSFKIAPRAEAELTEAAKLCRAKNLSDTPRLKSEELLENPPRRAVL